MMTKFVVIIFTYAISINALRLQQPFEGDVLEHYRAWYSELDTYNEIKNSDNYYEVLPPGQPIHAIPTSPPQTDLGPDAMTLQDLRRQNSVQQQLHSIVSRGLNNPCKAQCSIDGFMEDGLHGYGSQSSMVISQLVFAMVSNRSVAFCGENAFKSDPMWHYHVGNSMQIGTCHHTASAGCSPPCDRRKGSQLQLDFLREDASFFWDFRYYLGHKFFELTPEAAHYVQKIWSDMGFQNTSSHIGVHIRRGDKATVTKTAPIKLYADQVMKLQRSFGHEASGVIYVASDDKDAPSQLRNILSANGLTNFKVLSMYDPGSGKHLYTKDGHSNLMLLADIHALVSARAFIGTQSSSIGRFIKGMRGKDKVTESVDGQWGQWPIY